MAFSSWFSRLSSSSRNIYRIIQSSSVHIRNQSTYTVEAFNFEGTKPMGSRSSSLIPLVVALSAGSIVIDMERKPSMCDATSVVDYRGGTAGGKDSTGLVVTGSRKDVPQELIDELKAICGGNMTLDYDERYFHGKPQNSFHKAVNIPDIVVFPRSEDEVSKIVRSCNSHRVPIVPYGGATSIEGHTLSPHGGVCIDLSLMKVLNTGPLAMLSGNPTFCAAELCASSTIKMLNECTSNLSIMSRRRLVDALAVGCCYQVLVHPSGACVLHVALGH